MFQKYEVARDHPGLARVLAHFERNLRDIVRAGAKSGATVVLCTVAVNWRDCAPFGSAHRSDLSAEQRTEWERFYQAGVTAETAGQWESALQAYARAAEVDDGVADLHFRRGRCLLRLGRTAEAALHFHRATDLDTLRFRADSVINGHIRRVAAELTGPAIKLVDAEQRLVAATADGIPGEEWFYDHVHLNFSGNYRVALALAEAVAMQLPSEFHTGVGAWLSEAECARRLGYSAAQERDILEIMRRRFTEPVYRRQLDDAERLERVRRRLDALRGEAKPAARLQAARRVREALTEFPEDPVLHGLLARTLAAAGESEAALAAWGEVSRRWPHDANALAESAELLVALDRQPEALAQWKRALEVNPVFARAHEGLGLLLLRQQRPAEARVHLRAAVRLDPTREAAARALAATTFR